MELSIYKKLQDRYPELFKVYDCFKNFYGEDRVDLQFNGLSVEENLTENDIALLESGNYFNKSLIIVHWPEVTVTNELNKSEVITDLYAKITVTSTGALDGRFLLNRSSYTLRQFLGDYMHSHIPGIPISNPSLFLSPCTGSGPINHTMSSLNAGYSEDIWNLFCLELDKYVHTESLSGGPYRRLESIDRKCPIRSEFLEDNYQNSTIYFTDTLKRFTKLVVESDILRFNYIHNQYGIANSKLELLLKISNLFIKFMQSDKEFLCLSPDFKEEFKNRLGEFVISDNQIYYRRRNSSSNDNSRNFEGKIALFFKGHNIPIKIFRSKEDKESINYLLDFSIINTMLRYILLILNFNSKNERCGYSSNKKVYFL